MALALCEVRSEKGEVRKLAHAAAAWTDLKAGRVVKELLPPDITPPVLDSRGLKPNKNLGLEILDFRWGLG